MVTLDIEDNAIKILVVQGKKIQAAISQPLEPGLIKHGVILDPKAVGQIIKDLYDAHGIQEKSVVVSVSGIHSIYRIARLPKLSGDLMAEAVKREISRLIPVPLEEIYTSWQAIPDNNETVVPLIGVPRETIDFMLATLREADLNSKVMDIKPLAIARVADETDAMIINIQPLCFDIVVINNRIPELIRSLPFSETSISVEDKIKEIREELDRTVNFYNSSNPVMPITDKTKVFISGALKDIMAGQLGYTVKPLPDLLLYPDGFNPADYVVNIGLVLKQSKISAFPVRVNINVIPEAYQTKPVSVVHVVSWLFILLAAIILTFMIINVQQLLWQNSQLQNQVKNLNSVVASRQASKPEIDKLQAGLQKIEGDQGNLQQLLNNFASQRNKVNKDLAEITSLVSGKITLNSISYNQIWTVKGSAPNSAIILNYVFALQGSNRFSSLQLFSMNEVQYNQWDFTISVSGN